jgi:hypothetical protein
MIAKRFVAFVAAWMLTGCGLVTGLLTSWEVKWYGGDGSIETCSQWFAAGWQINFSPFDASKPFAASYRISKLPHILGRDPMIYLKFDVDNFLHDVDSAKSKTTARFDVELLDPQGRVIQTLDLQTRTAIWWGGGKSWGLYDLDRSAFHFEPHKSYTLRVRYEPGDIPPPAEKLYFSIDKCAYK